jgi:hypothetical protein
MNRGEIEAELQARTAARQQEQRDAASVSAAAAAARVVGFSAELRLVHLEAQLAASEAGMERAQRELERTHRMSTLSTKVMQQQAEALRTAERRVQQLQARRDGSGARAREEKRELLAKLSAAEAAVGESVRSERARAKVELRHKQAELAEAAMEERSRVEEQAVEAYRAEMQAKAREVREAREARERAAHAASKKAATAAAKAKAAGVVLAPALPANKLPPLPSAAAPDTELSSGRALTLTLQPQSQHSRMEERFAASESDLAAAVAAAAAAGPDGGVMPMLSFVSVKDELARVKRDSNAAMIFVKREAAARKAVKESKQLMVELRKSCDAQLADMAAACRQRIGTAAGDEIRAGEAKLAVVQGKLDTLTRLTKERRAGAVAAAVADVRASDREAAKKEQAHAIAKALEVSSLMSHAAEAKAKARLREAVAKARSEAEAKAAEEAFIVAQVGARARAQSAKELAAAKGVAAAAREEAENLRQELAEVQHKLRLSEAEQAAEAAAQAKALRDVLISDLLEDVLHCATEGVDLGAAEVARLARAAEAEAATKAAEAARTAEAQAVAEAGELAKQEARIKAMRTAAAAASGFGQVLDYASRTEKELQGTREALEAEKRAVETLKHENRTLHDEILHTQASAMDMMEMMHAGEMAVDWETVGTGAENGASTQSTTQTNVTSHQ